MATTITMRTILITGAANGLGAAFLAHYQTQPNTSILAVDRLPISTTQPNIRTFIADLSSELSILNLTTQLTSQPIDLLIHSAGIRGLVPSAEDAHPDNVQACETLEVMDLATITRTIQINAVGTFALLRSLLPNLRASQSGAKVILMSSRMGSIGNNELPNKDAGSAYAYRASKAALNMLVRSLAVDVPEVVFVLCHPGRVETKLVRCLEEGAISAGESVEGLLPLIERWGKADSGRFYDRFGEVIQW